jgi:hypothetical protein
LAVQNAEAVGMTPELLKNAYETRFAKWAEVAGQHVSKLAWVSAGSMPGYHATKVYLNSRAAELGLGVRGGGLEAYNEAFHANWGVVYNEETQKVLLDENWGYRDYQRYLGGEDETFPNDPAYDEWFKTTIFVESFLGASFLWVPHTEQFLRRNRAILDWFSLRSGKELSQSPDVAIWLRENYRESSGCLTVKNIEIGIHQIDGVGKNTIPTEKYDRSGLEQGHFDTDCDGIHYDYLARRSDVATGNDAIALALDDEFKNSLAGQSIAIKVTFVDNSNAQWRVETKNSIVGNVQNQNDGHIKTATFLLNASELDRYADGSDFFLKVTKNGDLTVKLVRVLRWGEETSSSFTVHLPLVSGSNP